MNRLLCSVVTSCVLFICIICNASLAANKERPYALLSDDHGILSNADFKDERIAKEPYDIALKNFDDYIFWQCFPRDAITIGLQELGYSSEDVGWVDNYSCLTFTAINAKGIRHEYQMRRIWPIPVYLEKFNVWLKLMRKEKYICIAGSSPYRDKESNRSGKNKTVSWTFEWLKTKKGCDSYFENNCPSV